MKPKRRQMLKKIRKSTIFGVTRTSNSDSDTSPEEVAIGTLEELFAFIRAQCQGSDFGNRIVLLLDDPVFRNQIEIYDDWRE